MERCPVEVWQRILSLACTDGGYTGCSLSLVSRFMRDAVEPARLHSVMLIGRKRCIAFAALLNHSSPQTTIRHLFVNAPVNRLEPDFSRKNDDLTKALTSILTRIRLTLGTLFLYDVGRFNVFHSKLQFPVLKDLTVPHLSTYELDPELDHIFPTLERLHVYQCFNCCYPDLWLAIAIITPTISSLKLAAVYEDRELPMFLRVLLDIPPPQLIPGEPADADGSFIPRSAEAMQAETIAGYLPRLKYVTLEPWYYKTNGRCGTGSAANSMMLADLNRLAITYSPRDDRDVKLCILPEKEIYTAREARADWLEVVEGRDGQWPQGTSQAVMEVLGPLPKRSEVALALQVS